MPEKALLPLWGVAGTFCFTADLRPQGRVKTDLRVKEKERKKSAMGLMRFERMTARL